MLEYLNKNKLLLSILVNFVLFSIIYLLFSPNFITNDDTKMMFIVSGMKGVVPSEFMIFTNVIIGYLLKFLYEINNSLPWYGLYLITMLFITHTIFLYIFLRKYSKLYFVFFTYLLYFGLIASFVLINLQFTIIATITSFSGILLIFYNIQSHGSAKTNITELTIGAIIMCVGSLIRWDSFLLAILSSIPFIVFQLVNKNKFSTKKFSYLFKPLLFFIIGIALSFSAQKFNSAIYHKTKGYSNFYQYNTLRSSLLDYNLLEKLSLEEKKDRLNKAGWSNNDYLMFKNWFFVNDSLYNIRKYRILTNGIDKSRFTTKSITNWFKMLIFKRTKLLLNLMFFTFNLFLFIFLFRNLKANKKAILFLLFGAINITLLLIILIIWAKPAPTRVYFGMFIIFSISNVLFIENISIDLKNKINQIFLIVLFVFSIYIVSKSVTLQLKPNYNTNKKFKKYINDNFSNENIYVNWAWGINEPNINPLSKTNFIRDKQIIDLGWETKTPVNIEKFKKIGIQNIYTDIINNKKLFVVVPKPDNDFINLYKTYMKEHYNQNIEAKYVFRDKINSSMVQFYTKEYENLIQ